MALAMTRTYDQQRRLRSSEAVAAGGQATGPR
jgi:hypothetical protein